MMSVHALATVQEALTGLNIVSLLCSIWLTDRARRLAAPVQQPTTTDLQEVRSFAARPQGTLQGLQP
jgi:tRNA (Thr-GGU) A37 N-methylase